MGIFDKLKAKRAEREYNDAMDEWQEEVTNLEQFVYEAENHNGVSAAEAGTSFMPKKDEVIFAVLTGTGLVEPRRTPGQTVGGSRGVSIRIAKGVTYRAGASRGTYVPGPEQQTMIDEGEAIITNQRVVFIGGNRNREWAYSKMLGFQHDPAGATYIQVSNRQKVSGIAYGRVGIPMVPFKLDLALAHFSDEVDELRSALREQLAEVQRRKPPAPALPG